MLSPPSGLDETLAGNAQRIQVLSGPNISATFCANVKSVDGESTLSFMPYNWTPLCMCARMHPYASYVIPVYMAHN